MESRGLSGQRSRSLRRMPLAAQRFRRRHRESAIHRRPEPDGQGGVPNITQYKLKNWTERDIAGMLADGMTPDADLVGGSMIEIVANTSKLTAATAWRSRSTSSRCRPSKGSSRRRKSRNESAVLAPRLRVPHDAGCYKPGAMNLFKAIGFKLISALLFAAMSALVRQLGGVVPLGQVVFFRGALRRPAGASDLCAARRTWQSPCAPTGRSANSAARRSASAACSPISLRSHGCRWRMPPQSRLRRR